MRLTIESNFADVARQLREMNSGVAKMATARALNRTMEQAKTAMSRGIRAEFMLPAATVNKALRINKAKASGGTVSMEASLESPQQQGRSLNLIHFTARQAKRTGLLTVKIKRNGGRKAITGAFIANQGRTVFERMPGTTMGARSKYSGSKHAQQIRPVQTIDVAQMFNTRRIHSTVVQVIEAKFPEIFEREARYYIDRFNARNGR